MVKWRRGVGERGRRRIKRALSENSYVASSLWERLNKKVEQKQGIRGFTWGI